MAEMTPSTTTTSTNENTIPTIHYSPPRRSGGSSTTTDDARPNEEIKDEEVNANDAISFSTTPREESSSSHHFDQIFDWSSGFPRHVALLKIGETTSLCPWAPPLPPFGKKNGNRADHHHHHHTTTEATTTTTTTSTSTTITRLSSTPDIFLIRNFVNESFCQRLIQTVQANHTMTLAGIRQNDPSHQVRKDSYLTWLSSSSSKEEEQQVNKNGEVLFLGDDAVNSEGSSTTTSSSTTMSYWRNLALHATIDDALLVRSGMYTSSSSSSSLVVEEDIQVAKYNPGGRFDLHNDGYGRFRTVLTYLNGVGGTYFPLANVDAACNKDAAAVLGGGSTSSNTPVVVGGCTFKEKCLLEAQFKVPGRDGLLVVGKEGAESYGVHHTNGHSIRGAADDGTAAALLGEDNQNNHIVYVSPGDALVFSNYHLFPKEEEGEQPRDSIGTTSSATTFPPSTRKVEEIEDHQRDWTSIHQSLTVPTEKWIATQWFRSPLLFGPFGWIHQAQLMQDIMYQRKERNEEERMEHQHPVS